MRLAGATTHSLGFPHFDKRAIVAAALSFLILTPVIYYGVSPGIYDRRSPVAFLGDTRLNLGEWQAAASFTHEKIPDSLVYGVSLAHDFISPLANKEVDFFLLQLRGDAP